MEIEGVVAVEANCSRGTALVTMSTADGELEEDAATAALAGAGSYRLTSMAKVEAEEEAPASE